MAPRDDAPHRKTGAVKRKKTGPAADIGELRRAIRHVLAVAACYERNLTRAKRTPDDASERLVKAVKRAVDKHRESRAALRHRVLVRDVTREVKAVYQAVRKGAAPNRAMIRSIFAARSLRLNRAQLRGMVLSARDVKQDGGAAQCAKMKVGAYFGWTGVRSMDTYAAVVPPLKGLALKAVNPSNGTLTFTTPTAYDLWIGDEDVRKYAHDLTSKKRR